MVGVGASVIVFMFVLIHGWPNYIMFIITAIIFLVAGILASKWNHKTHWYSGLLVALPLWILLLDGKTSNEAVLLPLLGLVFAYIGSFISPHLKLRTMLGDDLPNRSRVFFIAGALCLIIPVLKWALWIYIFESNPTLTPQEKTDLFLGYFPTFIRNVRYISLSTLILSVSSVVLSLMALMQSSGWLKLLSISVLILLGSLVTLLQLFSML